MPQGALSDLKVLDLGDYVSAPWCARVFANLGAEVIKIEPPDGDRSRLAGPFPKDIPHPEKSGLYLYINAGKLGVTLDVTNPAGRKVFLEMVAEADIIIDNHRPDELLAWGLDYDNLKKSNPNIILTSITPFGWTGPWSKYKGNDLTAFHSSGTGQDTPFDFVSDPENEFPLKGGEYQADMMAGWTAASATMVALRHRELYGEGQLVDISAQESMATMIRNFIASWTYAGDSRNGRLKRGANRALQCKDGHVCLIAGLDRHWGFLQDMMGKPAWASSDQLSTREGRQEHSNYVDSQMEIFMSNYTKAELFDMAQEFHVPLFPISDSSEVMDIEQYKYREFWEEIDHPIAGTLKYPGIPYHFSSTPPQEVDRTPAPLLGEHNEEIFSTRLGYAKEDIVQFLSGSVGSDSTPDLETREMNNDYSTNKETENKLPLEGIRVIAFELGPAMCLHTLWMGSLGAEVIKIGSELRPDTGYMAGSLSGDGVGDAEWNRAGAFMCLNYNKKTCSINMQDPKGAQLAHKLISQADIVVENFTTPVTKRFGLTYDALKKIKPDIIVVSQSSMGRTGPAGDLVGWGTASQAYAGLPFLTGYEGGKPQSICAPWPDPIVGVSLVALVLAALHHRDRTGEGQAIDLSMTEMVSSMIPQALLDYQMNGRIRRAQGNKDSIMVPHNVYKCSGEDNWIALAVETETQWESLCNTIGQPEWITDSRFANADARRTNESQLDEMINLWTITRDKYELTEIFQSVEIAASPVMSTMEIFNDPTLRERGFFVSIEHPDTGHREVMGIPVVYGNFEKNLSNPAPSFGDDNEYVFKDVMGLSGTEIEDLIESGVIH
ncbi:MAG: CoA transferase [Dehalococcoidia bacterium]|nr:CoA transferase [Dehalococcoidia bacterium]